MKVIALLSLTLFFTTLGIAQEIHPWTDLQGRTLEASYMKSDGVNVTINWNGKVVPIPLASLSPESQALAQKLSAPSVSVNPFDTIKAPANPKQLHPWTDLQGRTLKAVFIRSDSSTVTVEWQGKVVPLPLASLNSASKALAMRLGGGFQTKVVPVETKKEVVTMNPASSGKLSLDAEHNWKSSTGSLIKSKFISIE